jgi:hypothetical protein
MRDIAVAHSTSPRVSAYPWNPGVGFGVKYANPATLPTGDGYGVAFCGNTDIAVAHNISPYVSTYPWTPGVGFGVKYANPATLPPGGAAGAWGVAFCGNTDIAVAAENTPFISAYPWNPGVGFGVKYADPATLPTGAGKGVAFCGNTDIAVAHSTSPRVSAYPWNPGVGFGVKYADPATLPTGDGRGVAFCGNTDIAVAHATTPYISAYPWNPGVGFGVKYANPATRPASTGRGVAFCGNTDIAVAHATTPYISAYPWNPGVGFGVKYANPATLPASTGNGVAFCGNTDIAVAHNISPYVSTYPWNPGVGFGVKYADPATLPASTGIGVAFMPAYMPPLPTVTTQAVSAIGNIRATGNGNVTVGIGITERGICWSLALNPTTGDSKVIVAGTTGAYTGAIMGLTPGVLYHVRAYAVNDAGTSYGADVTFTSLPTWTQLASGKSVLQLAGAYLQSPAANSTALNITSEDFTLMAWVNFSGSSADMIMCQGAVDVDGWEWYLFQGGVGTASLNLRTNQGGAHTGMGTNGELVTLNVWHLLATVRIGATCQHYIDGLSVAMLAGSLTNPVSVAGGNKFLVGVQNDEASNKFEGKLDHPRALLRALIATEILSIWNKERVIYGV